MADDNELVSAEVIRNPEADDPTLAGSLSKEAKQVLALYDVWDSAREDVNTMLEAAGAKPGEYPKADEARADLNERAAELLDRAAALLRSFGY